MAMMEICVWKGLILAHFFFAVDGHKLRPIAVDRPRLEPFAVDGQRSGPWFLVTFPAVIESGSDAKLCAILLKPNETLTMTVSLLDDKNRTTHLVQQRSASAAIYRCFRFQAPCVDVESVWKLNVVVKGQCFKMTEERKVMFRPYLPLTFIQTDKPIYNPGQTVNFRVVTMDAKFVPLDQTYSVVAVEDNQNNRIGQWTNVSSTRWILQLSHGLNPEAPVGMYTLRAFIGDRTTSQVFEVKKYVLPKFEVTVKAPQMYSVGDLGLEINVCSKYTYGQPVPGQALVEVCREPFPYIVVPGVTRLCINKTMNAAGCASLSFSTSVFFTTRFENNLQDVFLITANVTEEGTDVVMSKSATVSITFEVGKVTFLELPEFFDHGSMINGKVSASDFSGKPIASKAVYLLDVFSLGGSSTVTVQSSVVGGDVHNFGVTRDNRLLYQEKPLKTVPGIYNVKATGSTCVSVQVACFYNIPTPIKVARTLSVKAKVTGDCQPLGANLILSFTVTYDGPKSSTNMVIVDIKLLSGFMADTSPLGSPPNSFAPLVEQVDARDDHVLVYLKEVSKCNPMSYNLQLKQVLAVNNLKPAVINVYDYYQPSDAFETTYTSPCP
uniref:Alpha-macroglobulin receptor-binding domain-containing protein n=1 Tax=Cyprinus carpio TaxID=7962 RepID=A0A8C2KZM5_CYPCA